MKGHLTNSSKNIFTLVLVIISLMQFSFAVKADENEYGEIIVNSISYPIDLSSTSENIKPFENIEISLIAFRQRNDTKSKTIQEGYSIQFIIPHLLQEGTYQLKALPRSSVKKTVQRCLSNSKQIEEDQAFIDFFDSRYVGNKNTLEYVNSGWVNNNSDEVLGDFTISNIDYSDEDRVYFDISFNVVLEASKFKSQGEPFKFCKGISAKVFKQTNQYNISGKAYSVLLWI